MRVREQPTLPVMFTEIRVWLFGKIEGVTIGVSGSLLVMEVCLTRLLGMLQVLYFGRESLVGGVLDSLVKVYDSV